MSPSTERLAVSTRAPARALQLMKSHMFMEEEEEIEELERPTRHNLIENRIRQREEEPPFLSSCKLYLF